MSIKGLIKKFVPKSVVFKARTILAESKRTGNKSKKQKLMFVAKNYFKYKSFNNRDEAKNLINMYKKMDLSVKDGDSFIYFIDDKKIFYNPNNYSNGTVCYSLILDYSLSELKEKSTNEDMKKEYDALNKIVDMILERNKDKQNKYLTYINNLKTQKAQSLEEAFQRILFLNSVLWQARHDRMGLGRMDLYLDRFVKDMKSGEISLVVSKFLQTLHKDYKFKSGNLLGDTGQIIICGGLNEDGTYFSNKLTYIFIEELKKLQIPDPKVLLRVADNMPDKLLTTAFDCMKTGIGCPLLSNDQKVIPAMIEFGYEEKDAYNYVVSACWEPFVADVSAELNNNFNINFLKLFTNVLFSDEMKQANGLDDVLKIYYKQINQETKRLTQAVNNFMFGQDVLCSCFNKACFESQKLMKDFGAKYNNFGVTGLGLANVVDSLIAIDEIVFKSKQKSLVEFLEIVKNNFGGHENLRAYIQDELLKYGNDDECVVELTNKIINKTKELFNNNAQGKRRIKFGLSSPDYICGTIDIPATPDGRLDGEPANVHISCRKPVAFTELISFASKLDYSKMAFNGNVVDYMLTPTFLEDNSQKFVEFLKLAIKKGFFQMQLNVVSSETLIKAKNNPELYKNLIVRVWGFSAYFNELPEEYKNYLIERAQKSEYAYQ